MLNSLRLSARFFWREWKRGEWLVVFFALMIAVSVVTTLDFYSTRLKRGIEENNAVFLGGDAVISSTTPIPHDWILQAQHNKLRTAEIWSYPSVITAKNKMQLVNLLAVSDSYPLLGTAQRPEKQTVLIDPKIVSLLSLTHNQSLLIGAAEFRFTQISNENAFIDTGWLIAPRAIILLSDVPATKTVLPGSRINYRLLIAGKSEDIRTFKQWIKPKLKPGQRLIDTRSEEERLTIVVGQVENFLQLALLICLALCSIAIVLSTQRYLHNQYGYAALMQSLGAKQQIIYHDLYKLIFVALIAGLFGVLAGYGAQNILAKLFQDYMKMTLPAAGIKPIVFGFLLSGGLLLLFAYPILNVLSKTSPLFLWRNEVMITTERNSIYYLIIFFSLMLFIYNFTHLSLLTSLFMNFIAVCVGFLYGLSLFLLERLKKNLYKTSGVFRQGLNQLCQYPDNTSLQFISFTLILMLIIVLSLMRGSLIRNWQNSFSEQTPNYFAINIAQNDLQAFQKMAQDNQVVIPGIHPLIRGRLVKLNNQPILQAIPESARQNNALHRELNLTWMKTFPSDNKLVAGDAWPINYQGEPLISVEKKLAEDLHFKLGDRLTFQIGDQMITAKIFNFRTVSWVSFHPNFFVIFIPGVMDHFSATYITSFHLNDAQKEFLSQLVQHFPNITVIDVAGLLREVQDIVSKITYASEYLLLFSFGAAILVLIVSVQTTMDERKNAYRLWRILGASRRYIRQSILIEFSSLVVTVIFFAYLLSRLFVYLIEVRIFNV